jgi:dTDP-4-dehydrorhamnose reductase
VTPIILGDGLLGKELRKQTGWDFISRKSHGFDFSEDLEYYLNIIRYNEYDVVINCIANTDTYNKDESHNIINHLRVKDLVEFCNTEKIKLVHISTDYLYANSKPDAKETDPIWPLRTDYGWSKNLGDYHVELFSKDFLTIRTSFKPNPFPYSRAVYQVGNFDYVDVISSLIIKLIEKNATGVFNVGTEKKTMLELAERTVPDIGSCDDYNVLMPKDISMDLTKLKEFLK